MNKYEKERSTKIEKYLDNSADCGRFGRAFELRNARTNSKKTAVSSQGKTDNAVKFEINGKIKYLPVESKTNGGRVDDIGKNGEKFIIYQLDINNANTGHVRRFVNAKIIPVDVFMNFLNENGLIKKVNRNGVLDGYAIQCTSKKLYIALDEYPIDFDNETIYSLEDFEDITL